MRTSVAVERSIGAPANRVYQYIADFREHHPNFLPRQFSELVVEEGGIGAGTVHHFTLTLGGRTSTDRVIVDEPEPGRVLAERSLSRDMVTTFTVDPEPNGCTRVRIETAWEARGLRGIIERMLAPRMLRGLYAEELRLLDRYARDRAKTSPRVLRTAPGIVIG